MITFENLAVGTPVIVADIGGAAEPIRDGVNGFVFEPGNTQALLETLERAIAALDQYDTFSDNAKRSVEQYSIDSYCKGLIGLIR